MSMQMKTVVRKKKRSRGELSNQGVRDQEMLAVCLVCPVAGAYVMI